jgi:hypothetical protein
MYKYYKSNRRKIENFFSNNIFNNKLSDNGENEDELRLILKYLKKKNKKW